METVTANHKVYGFSRSRRTVQQPANNQFPVELLHKAFRLTILGPKQTITLKIAAGDSPQNFLFSGQGNLTNVGSLVNYRGKSNGVAAAPNRCTFQKFLSGSVIKCFAFHWFSLPGISRLNLIQRGSLLVTDRVNQPSFLPTPEEIVEKCEEIRQKWSDKERELRTQVVAGKTEFQIQFKDEL